MGGGGKDGGQCARCTPYPVCVGGRGRGQGEVSGGEGTVVSERPKSEQRRVLG
jgi:hypothetical protein